MVKLVASSSEPAPDGREAIEGALIEEGRTAGGIDETDLETCVILGRECVSSAFADEVKTAAEIPNPRTMMAPVETNFEVVENFSMLTPFIKQLGVAPLSSENLRQCLE